MGLQLSAADIYSVNSSSLKDAVLQFGSGCTGEIISKDGLLITNHHCGYSTIQSLSTISQNYLMNGFWAKSRGEEIPCPGLTVTFIKEIRDVTTEIISGLSDRLNEDERTAALKVLTDSLEKKYKTEAYKAMIRSFYGGNQFLLFMTETFRDIRFVGAPPESVGKFGGETDNWVWPRHTCDFSLFRIYANKNNKPADYSAENIPFTPAHHLPVNVSGVKEGDFVFVFGFPGRTNEYAPAAGVKLIKEQTNPVRVSIRDLRLSVWRDFMRTNDTIRLQYSSKFSTIENSYKKWKGELLGLNRFRVIEEKKKRENSLESPAIKAILKTYEDSVNSIYSWSKANDYYAEAFSSIEITSLALKARDLMKLLDDPTTNSKLIDSEIAKIKKEAHGFFKNYSSSVDRQMTLAMLHLVDTGLANDHKPPFLDEKRSLNDVVEDLFTGSGFRNEQEVNALFSNVKSLRKKISKDPAYRIAIQIADKQAAVQSEYNRRNKELNRMHRMYQASLLASYPQFIRYPDANSTLRVSYGKVSSLLPRDGVKYDYHTTADGILEKSETGNPDFELDATLEKALRIRDYGKYGRDGELYTAFISSCHTTGGNSGSPVINGRGHLVGINFDRIWEGVMSDYYFSEAICRNVSLDVRYMLFIVDKVYGAGHLINEMSLVE